jgi:hypothetical protein
MKRSLPKIKALPKEKKEFINFKGYKSGVSPFTVGDQFFTEGGDVIIDAPGTFEPRKGHKILGDYTGNSTKVNGLFQFANSTEVVETLKVYDTALYRLVGATWTAITGVTFTSNKPTDGCYFPFNNKFYMVNGTDNVVKYTSGTSADQTDSAFKQGKYIASYKNRLLVALNDQFWYTDNGADTFSVGNYFFVDGQITGIQVVGDDMVLIFTKRKLYKLQNFSFNGVVSGPEAVVDMGVTFGAIYDKSIVNANGVIYFLGQDQYQKVQVYRTTGYAKPEPIGNDIQPDLDSVLPSAIVNSAGGFDGRYVRFSLTLSGQTTNSFEIIFDVTTNQWLPKQTGVFSCYAPYESNGQVSVIAGSAVDSSVRILNQLSGYDEVYDGSHNIIHGAINSWAVWGSYLSVPDQLKNIKKIFTEFSAEGNYNIQFGIKSILSSSFSDTNIFLDGNELSWGGAGTVWGTSTPWGGQQYIEEWFRPPVTRGRFFQFRVRNYIVDRTFVHYATTVNFITKHSLR